MQNTAEITRVNAEMHVEAMRHLLQVVLSEVTGTEHSGSSMDVLIAELLCNGVSRQDIAFLINEAVAPFNSAQSRI